MKNIVIDTNVIVSSFISPGGNPDKIVDLVKEKKVALYYTDPILFEYMKVLFRAKFNLKPSSITLLIHSIVRFGILVDNIECELKANDETDQKFLNAVVAASSKYGQAFLITGNIKHFPMKAFIVTPSQFVEINLTSRQ